MMIWTYLHSMKSIAKLDDIFEILVFELLFVLKLFGEGTKVIFEESDEKYIGFFSYRVIIKLVKVILKKLYYENYKNEKINIVKFIKL